MPNNTGATSTDQAFQISASHVVSEQVLSILPESLLLIDTMNSKVAALCLPQIWIEGRYDDINLNVITRHIPVSSA